MQSSDEEFKQFEDKYKKVIFASIDDLCKAQSGLIRTIEGIEELKKINGKLPNIAVTLNNKIVEFSHIFKEAGISLFATRVKKYEQHGEETIIGSYIGAALMDDMIAKTIEGIEFLGECTDAFAKMTNAKAERVNSFTKAGIVKRLWLLLAGIFNPLKRIDVVYTASETEELNSYLEKYREKDEEVWQYNLKDSIIPALIQYIRNKSREEEIQRDEVEESVIHDLEKLGLVDLISQLKEELDRIFKKRESSNRKPGELTPEQRAVMQEGQRQKAKEYAREANSQTNQTDNNEYFIEEQS